MDTEQAVIEANQAAAQADLEDFGRPHLIANNGISRMSSDKDLSAKCDDVIYCYRKYGRYVAPDRRNRG